MAPHPERPIGKLFTHVYLDRGPLLSDSMHFRQRLGGFCAHHGALLQKSSRGGEGYAYDLAKFIKIETGFDVPYQQTGYNFERLFTSLEARYLLNVITIIWRFLNEHAKEYVDGLLKSRKAEAWHAFVSRALREEHLHYSLDPACGVHYVVDGEFEHNRVSALKCLESSRYAGARAAFEQAFNYFDANPPDTKAAARSIFESVEIVAKMATGAQRLNRQLVELRLSEYAITTTAGDSTAEKAIKSLFVGFAGWVDAIHNYRHGQEAQDPIAPPMELTVYVLSTGAAFLRWLVKIDVAIQAKKH